VTGHETLHFTVGHGTGDLVGLHAELTAEGEIGASNPGCDLSGAGTYNGWILFAP
jgi:hypothetical protein